MKGGLTWASYGEPKFNYFNHIAALQNSPHILPCTQFDADVAAGKLANVTWMYADGLHDEHPPYGANAGQPTVKLGMQWTVDRVNSIAKSKYWRNVAIFVTWDDWGGWYDHIEPKMVETWKGDDPPHGAPYHGTQFRYGPRVPCLVISPYAKTGYISKEFHSHVSIVKFCESKFGLPSLNKRDAGSDDMGDCFDFKQKPLPPPSVR